MQTLPLSLSSLLWHFIKNQKVGFLLLLPNALAWALQSALFALFVRLIIDKATEYAADKTELFQGLSLILLTLMGLWLLMEVGYRLYDFASAQVLPNFQAQVRMALFEYTLGHSHRYFADHFAGTIASRISRMAESMSQIITISITIFLPIVIAFCVNAIILYLAKPIFGIISFVWFLIHFSVSYYFTRYCSKFATDHSEALTSLNGKIVDVITNIVNVRLFSNHSFEMRYNKHFQQIEIDKNYALWQFSAWMKLVLGLLSISFFAIMVLLGIWCYQRDWISIGELALILTSLNLIGLAWFMGMSLINFFQEVGNCQEAMKLIQKPHEITDSPHAKELVVTQGKIVFDNLTFHYRPEHSIFKDKTVIIQPGEKLGLVGFSGSGKTTFVNLILRAFDPVEGRILIDDQDIKMVTQASLRRQVALIPQDPSLFHRSLLDNIRYGKLDASEEEVLTASRHAHCHEFIQHLQEGYQTLVGERGIKLSGGQRQRIAIARAILKNAPILILDEATSSLDSITEQYIQEALKVLMANRTTLVIAHRLSTLADMDRILVFKEGKIVEEGTHASLLALKGHYALLWSRQAGGFLPDTVD